MRYLLPSNERTRKPVVLAYNFAQKKPSLLRRFMTQQYNPHAFRRTPVISTILILDDSNKYTLALFDYYYTCRKKPLKVVIAINIQLVV